MIYSFRAWYLLFITGTLCAPLQLIDEILVIIYHEMGTVALLASDVRPALDGSRQTLRDVILNKLMYFDALYHGINVSLEEAEKYIENIQKKKNLSRKAVEDIFRHAGYTYAQAREYFREMQMIEQIVEYHLRRDKSMMITRAEAEVRYNENPPTVEAVYTLAIAFIAQDKLGNKNISDYLTTINPEKDLQFDDPFELKESEIADDRKTIITHKEGDIVFMEPVDGGYEVTRLVRIQPAYRKPFYVPTPENADPGFTPDHCYPEIMAQMRQERLEGVLERYYTRLLSQATLSFTHKEDIKILQSRSNSI